MSDPNSHGEPLRDPTKVTSQPALTTATGRSWLIVGGLFALISAAVLVWLLPLSPTVASVALALVVLLYAAMLVTQLLTRRGRTRLGLLAAFMLCIAAVALVGVLIIATAQIHPPSA